MWHTYFATINILPILLSRLLWPEKCLKAFIEYAYQFSKLLIPISKRKVEALAINPLDRDTWRSAVRSAMHAASQLPGRGSTDVILPLYM